jgi:phytoene desaturase
MLSREALRGIVKSQSYRSLYAVVSELVDDERIRMALTFQTMYLGLSPFEGPALFGLLPYTEVADGIWYAKGGLSAIAHALAGLAERCGATIEYGRPVRRIERHGGEVKSVVCEDGERIEADVVLANADLPYVYRALLGEPLSPSKKYTSSGFMLFLGCDRRWDTVLHHNVLFGSDYARSFEEIFTHYRVPKDPSLYVANPVVTDASMAPDGSSALYVLVPVPHLAERGPDWADAGTRRALRDHVVRRLEETIAPGLSASIRVEHTMTPLDWRDRFSLERGSAFGLSHTLLQVGALRPPNRDAKTRNLYFVGASTQPATGIPNVLIGARHVADRIRAEQRA